MGDTIVENTLFFILSKTSISLKPYNNYVNQRREANPKGPTDNFLLIYEKGEIG